MECGYDTVSCYCRMYPMCSYSADLVNVRNKNHTLSYGKHFFFFFRRRKSCLGEDGIDGGGFEILAPSMSCTRTNSSTAARQKWMKQEVPV